MSKLTLNELSNSLNDYINEKQNVEDYSLMTENKTIIGAINEIYGKEIIADAIGEPLKASDTFQIMSDNINDLLSTFKANMMNNGVTIESGDKFKQLIDKITKLADNKGKGLQFAESDCDISLSSGKKTITTNLPFVPTYIFAYCTRAVLTDKNAGGTDILVSNICTSQVGHPGGSAIIKTSIKNISKDSFTVDITGTYAYTQYVDLRITKWFAIGKGEDSIAEEKPLEMEFTLNDLVSIQYEAVDGEGYKYDATALGVKLSLGYIPSRMMVYSLDNPWKGYTYMSYNSTDESKTIIYSSIGNYFQYMHVMITSYLNANLITEDQINLPIYWNAGGTASKPTSEYRFKLIIYK